MFGILFLAVLVFALAPSKSSVPKLPTGEPCEIWITIDDKSIAICGHEGSWQLLDSTTDTLLPEKHKELSVAVGRALRRIGALGLDAKVLIVSTPRSRVEMRHVENGWDYTIEFADGGIKHGHSDDSVLDALGEVWQLQGGEIA